MKIQSTSWLGFYLGNLLRPSLSLIHTYLEKASASEFFPLPRKRGPNCLQETPIIGVSNPRVKHMSWDCARLPFGAAMILCPRGSVFKLQGTILRPVTLCFRNASCQGSFWIFLQLSYTFCFQPRPSNDRTLFRKY